MTSPIYCDGLPRRNFVRVGGLSALGLGLGNLFQMQRLAPAADSPAAAPKAKACILIWLDGGPSHLEMFDPKAEAPAEVRGPLASIATKLPGVRFGECFERSAAIIDHLAVVRSMTSPLGEHNFGTHYMMTGYKPSPSLAYPTFGATLAALRATPGVLPPNIAVPQFTKNISGNGFLSASSAPFSLGDNPERADFKVRDLDFYHGLDLLRLDRRRQFVEDLNAFSRAQDAQGTMPEDSDLQRAYNLIASTEAKRAFDLSEEPDSLRARYGRTGGNGLGQSCLLARRLVERGVPFVTVNSTGWDTHQDLKFLKERYPGDPNAHLPALDRALSGLVSDLRDRGLLDQTLVIVMGEFGRTPKINSNAGRDHWPNVFSVVLAGGGVQGGQVVGSSDSLGEFPKDNPITPADLAATIYTLLGIDPALELRTSDGRAVRIAAEGARVIRELMT